jgi:hypothetical protein
MTTEGRGGEPCGRVDETLDFSDSSALVEAGDLFAVLIHRSQGQCVVTPFSLTDSKGTPVPSVFANRDVDANLDTITTGLRVLNATVIMPANLSFYAGIEL